MSDEPASFPADFLQSDAGLALVRLAALHAREGGRDLLDQDGLDDCLELVRQGALSECRPREVWSELVPGLMSKRPSTMLRILSQAGALPVLLPEVAALFGVPMVSDSREHVDVGWHVLKSLDQAARADAPLSVRFALLAMHAGKPDSPPEHLPVHYRHIDRAVPRIHSLCDRFGVPDDARDMALLALHECERVGRVSEVRAGPVADMLERQGAFDHPERFRLLMLLCECDYRAYGGDRAGGPFPKADLLRTALVASLAADTGGMDPETSRTARAHAIAKVFGSMRWS